MTAHPPDRRTNHEAPLRMSLIRAGSVFGLLALFFAWMGKAGIAVIVAKLFFFLCLVMFMVLLTLGIILGPKRR